MEQTSSKKKTLTVAAAAVAVLALVGVIAYLADASGTIRNIFSSDHSTHLEVEITETDVPHDNGNKQYEVTPGSTADKDPKVSVDTNGDAYVYAIVKDTINNNAEGKKFVDYQIADGWVELDKNTLTDKDIQKYNEIFKDKDLSEGNDKVHIDVDDPNTRIFYRIVNGTDDETRFEYPVLEGNSISYPSTLTNDDLAYLKSIAEDKDRALDFQTYAIQMTPFCPADKVKDADPTSDEQKGYAAEAWNQKSPTPAATDSNNIETTAHTLTVYPTVPGDQYIVVPTGTDPEDYDWTKGQTSDGGKALTFTGLDADTEYDVISRTPATSDQGVTSDPSKPTTTATKPLATGLTVTEKSGKTGIAPEENAQMVATVEPEIADQEVTWSSSDPSVATVDPVTGKVTGVSMGNAVITATAKDGSGVKGEYPIEIKSGKWLYQVKLHDVTNGTATFWPAIGLEEKYGKKDHGDTDCICEHTWAEIANQTDAETGESLDFSRCIAAGCTKSVPINPNDVSGLNKVKTDTNIAAIGSNWNVPTPISAVKWDQRNDVITTITNACEIEETIEFYNFKRADLSNLSKEQRRLKTGTNYQAYWLDEATGNSAYHVNGTSSQGPGTFNTQTKGFNLSVAPALKVTAN